MLYSCMEPKVNLAILLTSCVIHMHVPSTKQLLSSLLQMMLSSSMFAKQITRWPFG